MQGAGEGAVTVAAATERRRRRDLRALLVLPAALWLLVFAVAPLGLLFTMSFWTSSILGTTTGLTLDNYRVITPDPIYLRVLLQTLRIAATVTILTLVDSYPMTRPFLEVVRVPGSLFGDDCHIAAPQGRGCLGGLPEGALTGLFWRNRQSRQGGRGVRRGGSSAVDDPTLGDACRMRQLRPLDPSRPKYM